MFLEDGRGKILARLENNMVNYYTLKKWLGDLEHKVEDTSLSSWQEEKISEMCGLLHVKKGKSGLVWLYIRLSILLLLCIACALALLLGGTDMTTAIIMVVTWPVVIGFLIRDIKVEHMKYRNLSLVLTTAKCRYTDRKGNVKEFLFEEIGSAEEVRIPQRHDCIIIRDWQGQVIVSLRQEVSLKNSEYICPFITYHQQLMRNS